MKTRTRETVTPPSDLMGFQALAEYLGKSKPHIYKLMREDGLPARRLGSRWIFSKSEVDAWFKALPGVNLPVDR